MELWLKILLTIFISIAIPFIALFAILAVAFGGGGNFYASLTLVISGLVLAFLLSLIWRWPRPRIRNIALGAAAVLICLSVAAVELPRIYENSFERISEQGVDLSQYEPFREDSKAASLPGPASLHIEDDLPRMDGATALYPLYAAFARAVYPGNPTIAPDAEGFSAAEEVGAVLCSKTDIAYWKLINGEADVIFVAGPSQEQRAMAEAAGVELTLTPIGRDAFVFFVNAQNPVDGLSTDDIRRIYSGAARSWQEVGGKNQRIRAFQRPLNSGSQTAMIGFMGDAPLMAPPTEDVAATMGGIIREVSAYRNYGDAIGYSFLFFVSEMAADNRIKLLSLDGIAPTRDNVANGTYPYATEFYAVTAGTDNPNIDKLIEWILSEQGQYLVEQTGYTRLNGH